MKIFQRKPLLIAASIALLGGGSALQLAAAQTEAPLLPEVLVEAGPVERAVVGRSIYSGAPIERITVDYRVHFSDLDLLKHADVQTLHERVEMAAQDACEQLDELFPVHASHGQSRACIEDAVRGAAPRIQQAVAAVHENGSAAVAEVAEQSLEPEAG